jgi:hypothetical protein
MKDLMLESPSSSPSPSAAAAAEGPSKRRKSLTPPPSSRTRSKHRRCVGNGVGIVAGAAATAGAVAVVGSRAAGTPLVVTMAEESDDGDFDVQRVNMDETTQNPEQSQQPQDETSLPPLSVDDINNCIKTLFPDHHDLAAVFTLVRLRFFGSRPCSL